MHGKARNSSGLRDLCLPCISFDQMLDEELLCPPSDEPQQH